MKQWIILIALTALAGTLAAQVDEKPARPAPERQHFRRQEGTLLAPGLVESLKLTQEQKEKYNKLQTEFAMDQDRWRQDHKDGLEKLRSEMDEAEKAGNKDKVEQLRQKRMEMFRPTMELRKQYIEKVRALLNDEQKPKLNKALEDMQERRGPPPAGGRPGRGPRPKED